MDQVAITTITEETILGPNNTQVPVVKVQFKVGSHGPFTERFPKAEFDPSHALAKVTQFAQKLGLLTGQS